LLLLAINPKIGGLLIRGEKGTGKSALVRALADLLPPIKVVADCPFNDDPDDVSNMCTICRERVKRGEKLPVTYKKMEVITLPLSASIDAVVGTLDIEKVLREGLKAFQPGILAKANRQILYIDEVNLLPDHIVDAILDAAAMGWNYVEREGVSISHPARFILIGTMNPEEGEIRPQLLDRFSLSVTVHSIKDEKMRMEIIKRNLEFAEDPVGFIKKWEKEQQELRNKIVEARKRLNNVKISDEILFVISHVCNRLEVDGHRPDIVTAMTAKTLAALRGKDYVDVEDVRMAIKLALSHRTRKGGLLGPPTSEEINKAIERGLKESKNFFREESLVEASKALSPEEKRIVDRSVSGFGLRDKVEVKKEDKRRKFGATFIPRRKRKDKPMKYSIAKKLQVIGNKIRGFLRKTPLKPESDMPLVKGRILNAVTAPVILKEYTSRFKEPKLEGGINWRNIRLPYTYRRRILIDERKRTLLNRKIINTVRTDDGIYIDYGVPKGTMTDIALIPTIKTAIIHDHIAKGEIKISYEDIRTKIRARKARAVIMILLDASDSMLHLLPMIGESIVRLKMHAWRQRDKLGLILCSGEHARILSFPTRNINVFRSKMSKFPVGGRTPLAAGILKAVNILKLELRKNPDIIPIILIFSDGIANVPLRQIRIPDYMYDLCPIEGFADSIYAAKLAAMAGIPIIAVNFYHEEEVKLKFPWTPTWLLKTLSEITGGIYVGFNGFVKIPMLQELFNVISESIERLLMSFQ